DPFSVEAIADFLTGAAPILGISCMGNLLPFTLIAMRSYKEAHPEHTIILGGVGPTAVERHIIERFPWIDIVARGEGELTVPDLVDCLKRNGDLAGVKGITFRRDGAVIETPDRERIQDLDSIGMPAFHAVDLSRYQGYGMVTSRGCPYPCTFCSVAPIWGRSPAFRSIDDIIAEMRLLNRLAGVDLFLLQDEYFVCSRERVTAFCRAVRDTGMNIKWKCFGRVNLTDRDTMREMARSGCIEIRYGIESGADRILKRVRKCFTVAQALATVPDAIATFPHVDLFYIWGFPFETEEDFQQSLFQMISFRMMGARILPSLLSLLPQTQLFRELCPDGDTSRLEFCPELFPEYMITGHEVRRSARVEVAPAHRAYFEFVRTHPDIFPGFFHIDLEGNILPKLEALQTFGFYPPEPGNPGGDTLDETTATIVGKA
ncbi:radical SAM protein, partial [bacterium]|nr:radical SAM protein [candidate division CSSED10-310 bacterium]